MKRTEAAIIIQRATFLWRYFGNVGVISSPVNKLEDISQRVLKITFEKKQLGRGEREGETEKKRKQLGYCSRDAYECILRAPRRVTDRLVWVICEPITHGISLRAAEASALASGHPSLHILTYTEVWKRERKETSPHLCPIWSFPPLSTSKKRKSSWFCSCRSEQRS